MFLCLPSGKVSETILTAEGRRNEEATPPKPRKMMICALVRERPQARVKAVWNRQPARYTGLLPTASAMEPSKRSVQPQVREYTDIGLESREHDERYNRRITYHSSSSVLKCKSDAIAGKVIITRLASRAFNPVAQTVIATTVFDRVFPVFSFSPACPTTSGLIGLAASTVEACASVSCIPPVNASGRVSRG
jgi:hypothetical protein